MKKYEIKSGMVVWIESIHHPFDTDIGFVVHQAFAGNAYIHVQICEQDDPNRIFPYRADELKYIGELE